MNADKKDFELVAETEPAAPIPFAKQVWEKLSRIDVAEHQMVIEKTAKRPEVVYLPWHKAWMLLKRAFPASTYQHGPDLHHTDGTIEVMVEVQIVDSENPENRVPSMARLAVMNFNYGAETTPDAREINDSRQRCLVKALAFAGLGLNLWSKADPTVPVGKLSDPINDKQAHRIVQLVEKSGTDVVLFLEWAEVKSIDKIPREKYKSAIALLESKVREA